MICKDLGTYWSADRRKMAEVFQLPSGSCFIDFYYDKKFIATRDYRDHTLQYVEDAAENYVMGILKVEDLI
jgi:hypothetical protein